MTKEEIGHRSMEYAAEMFSVIMAMDGHPEYDVNEIMHSLFQKIGYEFAERGWPLDAVQQRVADAFGLQKIGTLDVLKKKEVYDPNGPVKFRLYAHMLTADEAPKMGGK